LCSTKQRTSACSKISLYKKTQNHYLSTLQPYYKSKLELEVELERNFAS